jgi:CheY-like chemotaxis protein
VKRDGEDALDHLLADHEIPPALIVLDFQLPKLNGLEILARLRSHDKTRLVPVVIFSGTNSGNAMAECYRVGANSCVKKPVDAKQYIERLSWVIRYWLTVNETSDQLLV